MALREFTDDEGNHWQVWRVNPAATRAAYDGSERRLHVGEDVVLERRRRPVLPQRVLTPGLEDGWLCFESATGKRRLTPVPEDWERCPEEQLWAYCRQARVVPRRLDPDSMEPLAEPG